MAVGASLALASAPAAAAAPTCTDSWVGDGGNWFVAANWSTGAVPGPNDAVCITAPGNYTVTVPGGPSGSPSGQAVADTLQLGATSGTQKLVIEADNSCGDSTGAGGLEVFDHGGAITAASIGANGQVELTQDTNTCSTNVNGAAFRVDSGALSNAGLITTDAGGVTGSALTGREIRGTVLNAGGTLTIAANTSWIGTSFDNAGTISFPSAAVLSVPAGSDATFSDDDGGAINNVDPDGHLLVDSGNTFRMAADTGQGAPYSRPGTAPAVVIHSAALVYTGTAPANIEIQGQSTLAGNLPSFALLAIECSGTEPAVLHTASFTNAGSIGLFGAFPETCNAGRTLSVDSTAGPGTGTLTNDGQLEGYGTIAGSVTNAGSVTPGDAFDTCPQCIGGSYTTGRIAIRGGYDQNANGSLSILTAGSGAPGAASSTQLSVDGTAALNGRLYLSSNFVGRDSPGEIYQVLTAERVAGRFSELDGQPADSDNSQYVPVYNATNVNVTVMKIPTLTVRLAGRGWGEVDSDPSGISCNEGSCSSVFPPLQVVTLTAVPSATGPFAPPSTFAGWSGAGCHHALRCTVVMDGDRSVTARFLPPPPQCSVRLTSRIPSPTLSAVAICDKSARLRLSGTVTDVRGSGRRSHVTEFHLRPVSRTAARGRRVIFTVSLPQIALRELDRGHREAIRLTLEATDPNGTRRMSTRPLPLRS